MSRFTLTALAVLLLPLLLGASIACGGDSERDNRDDREERTSDSRSDSQDAADVPRDPKGLIPVDSEFAVILEVSDMLGGDAPRELQGEFEVWADELFDGDIDLYDVDTLVVIEDSLLLAQGNFDFDLIRDGLEGLGYEADDFLGFEVWGERAALIPQGDYVVIGFAPEAVRDLLQSADQGRDIAVYERNSDLASLLDEIGSGDVTVLMPSHCEDISTGEDFSTGGCYASGVTYTFLNARDDATMMRLVFLHEDSETAEDFVELMQLALLDDRSGLGSGDARADGSTAVLEVEVPNSEIDYFFDFFQAGPVARRLGPVSASVRPAAQVVEEASAPVAIFHPGGSFDLAAPIDLGGPAYQGPLDPDEEHFFEFYAQRGQTYVIETDAQFDSFMELYDESRNYLAGDDDGGSGTSSMIQWTAPSSESYFVMVRGLDSSESGFYVLTLTLTEPEQDDQQVGFDGATWIDIGDVADGRIGRGDEDYFVFEARRNSVYILETHAEFDTYMELYDEDIYLLASDDDGGDDSASRLLWTAPESGTFLVLMRGYGSSDSGSYELSLTSLEPDDHGDSMRRATRVGRDDEVDGTILAGEEDYFEIEVRRDRSYVFETEANFDTVIVLLDDSGREVEYDDDGGQDGASRLRWSADTSDRYFLVVRGYDNGSVGTYRLNITESR